MKTLHNPHWLCVADFCEADKTLSFSLAVNSARLFLAWVCSPHTLQYCEMFCKVAFSEHSHQQPAQVGLQDAWSELLRFWDHSVPHSSYLLGVFFSPSCLPVVTLTNLLEILEPKEVKAVFSFLCKTVFNDVRVGVLHNWLLISFFLI